MTSCSSLTRRVLLLLFLSAGPRWTGATVKVFHRVRQQMTQAAPLQRHQVANHLSERPERRHQLAVRQLPTFPHQVGFDTVAKVK